MKYARLFPKTIKETPVSATLISHQLLYRAGFIRESSAGRYYLLPLGLKVHQKIQAIIKQEMDKTGAQELVSPVLHPLELWNETNRSSSVGFELMKIKDRGEAEFVLGGTAEEMIIDLVRKFKLSYKDLPLNLYQFSTKFRDEMRARGGLLRVREFMMKDAYSFDVSEEEFKKEYQTMWETYSTIFKRLGLNTTVVESDNGYIGGDYCHEFVVESEAGESKFLTTDDGTYAAHEDIAKFNKQNKNLAEELLPMQEIDAVRGTTMEDGVTFHKLPLWRQIKDVLFVDEKERFILAIIRGDFDVNEVKLKNLVHAHALRHATNEEIREKLHSEPGFLSPVRIKDHIDRGVRLIIVADDSLRTIKNAFGGANKLNKDALNMNIDRDYQPDLEGDIALAKDEYISSLSKQVLHERKGIEVGNIFQLGFHYSKKMNGATFMDDHGKEKPYYMGCYGIGVGRTLAAVVEIHNDDNGIIWPASITPYHVHLIGLSKDSKRADLVYRSLQKDGYDVLYDDRADISAGEKFATADLLGIPVRLVVSDRTGDNIEVKLRADDDAEVLSYQKVVSVLEKIYE